ncbi:MAG: hypothetical protein L3J39_16800 [Verrucomicrobiales bacterium]|nr:hypothetical protein [Verrucomicrobiales bacterium]
MEFSPPVYRIRSKAYNSRRNFGPEVGRKRGESNFLRAFERAYFTQVGGGIAANEFAQPQLGVADLVWIAWNHQHGDEEFTALSIEKILQRRTLIAFEAKLKNWQQALQQAYRYRYFSDKAIVLMPHENANSAISNLAIFEEHRVGLWSFEKSTQRIRKYYTPTRVKALSPAARQKAIAQISAQVDLSKLGK